MIKEDNDCPSFKISEEFNIPDEKKSSFQSIFTFIRKKLQIKYSRKSHIDSILKKCKGRFFRAINDCLSKCLINVKINKLPHHFITNITIEYNKKFMNKNVNDLYKYFNKNNDLEKLLNTGYCIEDKKSLLKFFLSLNLSELYDYYINSQIYKKDIEFIRDHEGKRIAVLYKYVSDNFCTYYQHTKAHTKKEE